MQTLDFEQSTTTLTPADDAAYRDECSQHSHYIRASTEKAEALLNGVAEVIGNVSDMLETKQMVTATVLAKRVSKVAKAVEDALKDALKTRHQPRGEDGRTQNTKVVLDGENGMAVELRPKVTVVFNPARAEKELRSKGLYEAAVDTETVVTDPKALATAVERAMTALTNAGDTTSAMALAGTLARATETRTTLSEDRIAGLVQADKLTLQDAEAFYDRKTDHALYDATK